MLRHLPQYYGKTSVKMKIFKKPKLQKYTRLHYLPQLALDILKMPHGPVKTAWLQSMRKEFKTLVDNNTFVLDTPKKGESITPIMETFKVKILSDGSLDKLKTRIVVRGDLQSKTLSEDKLSPTASF
jgi:hypothetical protein